MDQKFKDEIIDWLYGGGSVLGYCRQEGKPSAMSVYRAVDSDGNFALRFARARVMGAAVLVDQAQEVADDGRNDTYLDDDGNQCIDHDIVARSKLRVDTLLKRAACFAPHVFGTKVALGGDASAPPIKIESKGPPEPSTPDLVRDIKILAALASEVLTEKSGGSDEDG